MAYYLYRFRNNKNFKIVFFIIFVLMSVDVYFIHSAAPDLSPNASTFLAGGSLGHYMQMLILWMLPAYLFLASSCWFSIDEKTRYSSILAAKFEKRAYLKKYLLSVFISTFLLFFINFIINYLIVMIVQTGTYVPYESQGEIEVELQQANPVITNLYYIISSSIMIGVFAVFTSCISFVFNKIAFVFLLSFAVWLLLITGEYSIMLAFQPFSEYLLMDQIIIYAVVMTVLIISSIALYIYRVRKDEI